MSNTLEPTESEFKNTLVVVTGSAQGIGKTIADTLVKLGARVARLDVQFSQSNASNSYVDDNNNFYFGVDVSDYSAVNEVIDAIEGQHGPIDYLISAAGILRMGELTHFSPDDWQHTFNINTHGVFHVCQAVAKKMRARLKGAIVVVSSNAATTARMHMGAYAASKAAVSQFVRCLGLELAQYNIRCNIVAPGSTDTAMQRQLWTDDNGPTKAINGNLEQHRLGIPLQRIATPEMVSDAVLFFLSNRSAHITMETLTVDGGATLGQ